MAAKSKTARMYTVALLFLSFALAGTCAEHGECDAMVQPCTPRYPFGDIRNCPTHSPQNGSQPLYQMEVLPGIGFDNLRNLDMGEVHYYNYSTCKISKDGRYLLPDSIFLLPIKESHVDTFAEFFDHWNDYTAMTAASVNAHFGFFSLMSAKFSAEFMATKSHQVKDKSKTTRVQIRHRLYTVRIQPGAQLHPTFKSRIFDIAANLQNNNTHFAEYLAELLVRDYGTHYLTSMEAGALLAQVDHVSSEYVSDNATVKASITASASASFDAKLSLGEGFSADVSLSTRSAFTRNRTHSELYTMGGPRFRPNLTIAEWEAGIPDALVGVDRSGDPLHFVINPTTLAELPEMTVRQVSAIVYKAINRYYKVNTRHGCTQPDSANFDFQANIDDGSCKAPETNFTFGGVFQNCTVDPKLNTENLCSGGPEPAAQVNPLTGNYTCPNGYTAVELHSGTVTHTTQKPVCHNTCRHCGFLGWSHCCKCQSVLTPFLSAANYQAYWCVATGEVEENSGYLFGGFYTSTASNPVTGSMTCPRYFIPVHFGEDIQVCVSNDYELAYETSIPFAGFESCQVGNPLAVSKTYRNDPSRWPHNCPHGYAQHLVTVDEGCEINFCVKAGAFNQKSLVPAKLPPFRKHPGYKKNVTEAFVVFGVYGEIWAKQQDGVWKLTDAGSPDGAILLDTFESAANSGGDVVIDNEDSDHKESPSRVEVAAISICGTIALGMIIILAIFACYCIARKKGTKEQDFPLQYSLSSPLENNDP